MRVLALDPGMRVGWASGLMLDTGGKDGRLMVTGHGIAYLKDAAMSTRKALLAGKYDLVIYEEWVLTAKGARVSVGSRMESSQFVGMIRQSYWDALEAGHKINLVPQRATALSSAERSLKCGHPSAAGVQEAIDKLPASHDESHDRSALLHLWHHFFEAYV